MQKKMSWKAKLLNIDVVIASAAMITLVALTFAGVIARYIVGSPFGWIEEIQAAMIVWVIFAAAGAAFRTANHAAIEIFYEMFPSYIRKLLDILILVVTVFTLLFLAKTCMDYIKVFMRTRRATAVLHIPFVKIYCMVPAACVWQIFNYIIVNFFHYSEKEVIEAITEEEFKEAKAES